MKIVRTTLRFPGSRGVALVVVLGMLVLVLVLVVAFLSSVSVELQSAKKYSGGADARTLADSAVSLVISQIQDATAGYEEDPGGNPISGRPVAWASQPGLIRTFVESGSAYRAYKLYSSDTMRVSGSFGPADSLGTEVPSTWASDSSRYVDLNKPVAVAGTNRYPILDPAAVASGSSGGVALAGSSAIEGCFINVNSPSIGLSVAQTNPVPMPVQWLYVLSSGTIAAVNPISGVVAGASKTDPIVGRIAFWTDDESSKVNINTASEGTFWDRPWTRSNVDLAYNTSMPMQNEYQRFPGHPAMTSLSVIFPPLGGESEREYNERIYRIIPRVANGGSESGTVMNTGTGAPNVATPLSDNDRLFASVDEFFFSATNSGTLRMANPSGPGSSFSVADLEKTRFFLTANSRAPEVNMFNKPRISLWPLQIDPDPVDGSPTRTAKDKLIAFCSTIGNIPYYFQRYNTYNFESNLRPGGVDNWANKQSLMPSSQSPTMDWTLVPRNRQLFEYLRALTKLQIPGLGGTLAGKYPDSIDQTLVEMFDFIRSGVNPQRTLDNKSGVNGDDIEYFYAPGYKRSPTYLNVIGQQQVVPLRATEPGGSEIGQGFGRFPSIKQAVLVFQASDSTEFKTKMAATGTTIVADDDAMDMASLKMRVVLLLDPFNVTPGQPTTCPNVRYKVRWVDANGAPSPCKVNGVALNFPDPAINLVTARDTELNATALGGIEYPYKYYEKPNSASPNTRSDLEKRLGVPAVGAIDEEQFYPFFTSEISVPGVPGPVPPSPAKLPRPTFQFEGGDLEIEIYPGYTQTMNPDDCVQTIRMSFPRPPVTLLRPRLEKTLSNGVTSPTALNDFNERLRRPGLEPAGNHNLKPLIKGNNGGSPYDHIDTVRSVEAIPGGAAAGDLRVYAALREVPASYFGVAAAYSGTAGRVHGLRIYPYNLNGNATTIYNGFSKSRLGKLVAGVNYFDDAPSEEVFGNPIVPNDLAEATMANGSPGDWDTGPGGHVDGPFINKPDMGNNGRFTSYFGSGNNAQTFQPSENGATYSPNRQISSAVAFGSLPTGIDPRNPNNVKPWQTLLFGKHPAAGVNHPGFGVPSSGPPYSTPPDHAFLDFFTMPIVEPYAISEPFSTAGKVNMNYQIAPFTYLTRNTGIRAVLKSTLITAIPASDGLVYKQAGAPDYRYTIDPNENTGTLAGFEQRFESGDVFRSASEICDISLVPKYKVNTTQSAPGSPTYGSMDTWWNGFELTGDNLREQPYGHIYPRLTTKSNTFTVHVEAQSISKAPGTPENRFVEGKDQVTGEFRGSFLIERYLDPNADSLVTKDGDSSSNESDPDTMVGPYKFRVITSKKFAP